MRLDGNSKAAASGKNYLTFNSTLNKLTLFKLNGDPLWSLETSAYPILSPSGNHIALVHPEGMSFSIYNIDRNQVLPRTHLGSMITDLGFCRFNDYFVTGTMGGEVRLITYQGEDVFRWAFTSSRYNYVKAITPSLDGLHYLVLTGLYPEHLVLIRNDGKKLWEQKTVTQRRQHVSLAVDSINNQILEPGPGDIYVRSLQTGNISYVLDLKNLGIFNIRYIVTDSIEGMTLIGINGENINCALLLQEKGRIFWKQQYPDHHLLYVGFSQDAANFMIHSSENIFVYHINGLKG